MAGGLWSALWGPRLWLRRLGQEVRMWVLCVERQKATKDVAWVSPTACLSPVGLLIA